MEDYRCDMCGDPGVDLILICRDCNEEYVLDRREVKEDEDGVFSSLTVDPTGEALAKNPLICSCGYKYFNTAAERLCGGCKHFSEKEVQK